jgi:protein-L-isoaspartate(D-aspartate) O-methyltransferase
MWGSSEEKHRALREEMVDLQLRRRGISDGRVLAAMLEVPRHLFVGEAYRGQAYDDHPLPIGCGQTISQPYMVARMTELLAPAASDRVLEVGAGCGYQSAILSRLCSNVHAAEVLGELATLAATTLRELGYANITVENRDASGGWSEAAPFDGILVAAGAPRIPEPLLEQLAEGGRLVIPVGHREIQTLKLVTRAGKELRVVDDTACRFVNLVGQHGWSPREIS